MKLYKLLLYFVTSSIVSIAQPFDFKTYSWDKKPVSYQLSPEEQKLSSITLMNKKFVEFVITKEDGLQKYQVTHNIQVLNDDRAVEASNKVYIPINYSSSLENIFSRVIINGKVVSEQGMNDVKKLEEKEVQYYLLALEGVGKGAMIETIIYLKLSGSLYSADYLQTQTKSRLNQYSLITPKNLIFKTKIYNSKVSLTDTVIVDKRYLTYSIKNVPAFEEEKYALENANRIRIEYNFEKNTEYAAARSDKWSDMGKIYFDRIYKNYDKNAKELDKIIKKLAIGSKTTEEKAFVIENYIKSSINMVQNVKDEELVSGIIKNKYATLFGITQLIALGLDRAKVPFEIVISCEKDDKKFDPDFDSWSFLNDVVIYLPESKSYITPGNQLLRLGFLPAGLLGQKGVFIVPVSEGKAKKSITSINTIAYNEIEKSTDKHFINVTIDDDLSSTSIEVKKEMTDYAAMNLKQYYFFSDEKQKKELIENVLSNGAKETKVSQVKVENYDITSLAQYKAPLIISSTLKTDVYLEKAGDKVLLKIGELIGPQEQIYQEKKRQNPIDMPYAHSYERIIKVKIPSGFKLEGLDKLNINHAYDDEQGPMFGFKSSYKIENGELVVICREYYNRTSFPVEKFEEFRKVINDAADFNKITILVKKIN